jgi:hypothetical protein
MTSVELKEIVDQRMADQTVIGRVACNLRSGEVVQQRHHDDRSFEVSWQDDGDYWRCIVLDEGSGKSLAQVDIHENGTVRVDTFEPGRVTVSPEDGILCVTRYKTLA